VPVVERYLQQWQEHGHEHEPEIGGAWHVFVCEDSQVARKTWEPRYRAYHEWMANLLAVVNGGVPSYQSRPFDFEWLTTEGPAIVGSPAEVVDRIAALSEQLTLSTNLLYMDMGGMPSKDLYEAIDLVGTSVIPQFAGAEVQA
jgi:alkanesulfonate monooxygenase SsuD/methylene tetrahydromethanopterin reductase-like flavin-dependent oxidoreductase (luciferase family)